MKREDLDKMLTGLISTAHTIIEEHKDKLEDDAFLTITMQKDGYISVMYAFNGRYSTVYTLYEGDDIHERL